MTDSSIVKAGNKHWVAVGVGYKGCMFSIQFTNSYSHQIPSPFHTGSLITARRGHREGRLLLHNPEHSPFRPFPRCCCNSNRASWISGLGSNQSPEVTAVDRGCHFTGLENCWGWKTHLEIIQVKHSAQSRVLFSRVLSISQDNFSQQTVPVFDHPDSKNVFFPWYLSTWAAILNHSLERDRRLNRNVPWTRFGSKSAK